ncbi:hypothetical protein [Cognatishimia sp. F0-27]|uniref:hypothetical protein n=1 Tax=Cognatishimia sp. F0-27 TaxID=2816855 RepID=UPI001D0C4EF8|nr:hypothetical protein [Cognatishimia sp. F0-27]MCC1494502.1 hypothetical protein [Cognatishimia sp. F0-27]
MTRTVFHRDFTLCKAALLAALIGVAAWMGDVPHGSYGVAEERSAPQTMRIIPAAVLFFGLDCDTDKTGVAL